MEIQCKTKVTFLKKFIFEIHRLNCWPYFQHACSAYTLSDSHTLTDYVSHCHAMLTLSISDLVRLKMFWQCVICQNLVIKSDTLNLCSIYSMLHRRHKNTHPDLWAVLPLSSSLSSKAQLFMCWPQCHMILPDSFSHDSLLGATQLQFLPIFFSALRTLADQPNIKLTRFVQNINVSFCIWRFI